MSGGSSGETGPTSAEALGPVRKPDTRIRLVWLGQVLVIVGIVGLVGGAAALRLDWLPLWIVAVLTAVIALLGIVWVILRYRAWAFQLRADALSLERGVFTHVETLVPHVRIQHVDTNRGPVDRLLGLSTLVVYTAGSRGADVSIPGLTAAEASDLQARVKELAIEAEGGDAL